MLKTQIKEVTCLESNIRLESLTISLNVRLVYVYTYVIIYLWDIQNDINTITLCKDQTKFSSMPSFFSYSKIF